MLISELAEKVGLHPETIRRLERRGVISSQRDVNGWRRYSLDALITLRKRYAQDEKQRSQPESEL